MDYLCLIIDLNFPSVFLIDFIKLKGKDVITQIFQINQYKVILCVDMMERNLN